MTEETFNVPAGIPAVGEVIAAKYCVERVLGVGGMGVVLAAKHIKLDERVAIKVLLPELARHQEVVDRFLREARASVRIKNEHVGRVFDVETLESGTPYMVMECLEGHDLSQLLAKDGPLSPIVVADYLLQACEALAEAHMLGIVHRDLKPSNLYLANRPDGSTIVKVLDFGIAKVADGVGDSVTKTNVQMGTPRYMAPEQLRSSRSVDARVDIWALGVVMYELLTRKVPFEGDSLASIAVAVVLNSVPSVRLLRPDVSPALEAVIARCLEKERDARFPSIAALAEALAPLASAEGVSSSQRIQRAFALARPPSTPTLSDAASVSSSAMMAAASSQPSLPAAFDVSRTPTVRGGSAFAAPSPAAVPMEKTNGAWQSETPSSSSRSRLWVAVGGAALAGGLAVALLMRAGDRDANDALSRTEPGALVGNVASAANPAGGAVDAGTATVAAPPPAVVVPAVETAPTPAASSASPSNRKSRSRPTNVQKPNPLPSARTTKRDPLPDIH